MERDVCVFAIIIDLLNFNSHAHVERDYNYHHIFLGDSISTHTLTWSVTYELAKGMSIKFNFNSHAHVERD